MNRAFLSHSSKDKKLVQAVYNELTPMLAEMDEYTFEAGLPSWDVIENAFDRTSLFVLFLSENSQASKWVKREVSEAAKRVKKGQIKRILIVVNNFGEFKSLVPRELQDFAGAIGLTKPKTIALTIRGQLHKISTQEERETHLGGSFVGREPDLEKLKGQLLDPTKKITSIVASGRDFMGRSSVIKRAITDINPATIFAENSIDINSYDSCTNIAIRLHSIGSDYISPDQIQEMADNFHSTSIDSCVEHISKMLDVLWNDKICIILADRGGVVSSEGSLSELCHSLIKNADKYNAPIVNILTRRRISQRARNQYKNSAFIDISPLENNQATQYVVLKSRQLGLKLTPSQVEDIVEKGTGVPGTYDYILAKCCNYPVDVALFDADDILEFNLESSKGYLGTIQVSNDARLFLKVLRQYPSIPIEFVGPLMTILGSTTEKSYRVCAELLDWHIIVESGGVYHVSPSLEGAIDRDLSLALSADQSEAVAKELVRIIGEFSDEGKIPVSAVDAVGIASIELGDGSNWSRSFVLPAHYIYVGRKYYDMRRFDQAIKFFENALSSRQLLSDSAFVQAARYLGMASARKGKIRPFKRATDLLTNSVSPKTKAWGHFVKGFKARLEDDPRTALTEYRLAEARLSKEFPVIRELALALLMLGEFETAITYGEAALDRAPSNPFLLDVVIRAYAGIETRSLTIEERLKLEDYYRRLKDVGSRDSSFYQVRMAARKLREKKYEDALKFAEEAIEISPNLAAVYLTRARVKMMMKNFRGARDDIKTSKEKNQSAEYTTDYFEAQVDRVEIELFIREKKWDLAIKYFKFMEDKDRPSLESIKREIQTEIKFDRRNHSKYVKDFIS